MTKVRKQKKKKRFNTSINRKRLRNRLRNPGNIENPIVKKAWANSQSVNVNLKKMGLASDANKALKIPSFREIERQNTLKVIHGDDFVVTDVEIVKPSIPKKHVLDELVEESKAPREKSLRLPKGHVEQITYFIDKYGSDYKAMERDHKNYWQDTWKQIRAKIKKFMGIPKLYAEYLKSRGLLDEEISEEDLKRQAEALQMNE